jgi:hypothetical protein
MERRDPQSAVRMPAAHVVIIALVMALEVAPCVCIGIFAWGGSRAASSGRSSEVPAPKIEARPSRMAAVGAVSVPNPGGWALPRNDDALSAAIRDRLRAHGDAQLFLECERNGGYRVLVTDVQRYAYLLSAYETGRLPELLTHAPSMAHVNAWPGWPSAAEMHNRAVQAARMVPLECDGRTKEGLIPYRFFFEADTERVRSIVAGSDAAWKAASRVLQGRAVATGVLPVPVYILSTKPRVAQFQGLLAQPGDQNYAGRSLGLAVALSEADAGWNRQGRAATLAHETAHLLMDAQGIGHDRTWLSEGVAMVVETKVDPDTAPRRVAKARERLARDGGRLRAALQETESSVLEDYGCYFALAEYIETAHGFDRLLAVNALVNGPDRLLQDSALRQQLGYGEEDLLRRTAQWLRTQP